MLNERQIKKIERAIDSAGFYGGASSRGLDAEYRGPNNNGAAVHLKVSKRYGSQKMTFSFGHSSLGGDSALDVEQSIRNLKKLLKLRDKISLIMRNKD